MGLHVPRGVWVGTTVLAYSAGMVNAAGYLGFEHQALSHLTGTTSLGAIAVGNGRWGLALQLGAVVASFVAGGYVAGLTLRRRDLSWHYVGLLAGQSLLLMASAWALVQGDTWGACMAAAACGLQNAMTTYYSGSAIRSTHLTGFFTDMGLLLGQSTRGAPLPWRRLALGTLVLFAFVGGGISAAWAFPRFGFQLLNAPALCAAAMAAALSCHLASKPTTHPSDGTP